jgi:hypothetical protein
VGLVGSAAGEGDGGWIGWGGVPLPPRILNITVPQVGHFPLIAFRPFFIVSSTASTISFLALHFTQYPSGIEINSCSGASCSGAASAITYEGGIATVNM